LCTQISATGEVLCFLQGDGSNVAAITHVAEQWVPGAATERIFFGSVSEPYVGYLDRAL